MIIATSTPPELKPLLGQDGASGVAILAAVAFGKSQANAEASLLPLTGDPIKESAAVKLELQPKTLEDLYRENEHTQDQRRIAAESSWTRQPAECARLIGNAFARAPSPNSFAIIFHLGESRREDMAFVGPAPFYVSIYSQWEDVARDRENKYFATDIAQSLAPYSEGSYINEFSQEMRPHDIQRCYAPQAWRRLADLRRAWDPDGLFHSWLATDPAA
jgi:FAD/FMN-containing dehydrogenase